MACQAIGSLIVHLKSRRPQEDAMVIDVDKEKKNLLMSVES